MRRSLVFVGFSLLAAASQAQVWQTAQTPLEAQIVPWVQQLEQFASFQANPEALRAQLKLAPMESRTNSNVGLIIELPAPDGSLKRFRLFESPIQSPAVERQTGVKTYAAQGIDDPFATGRFDLGINGFHGMVLSPNGDYFIEPVTIGNMSDHIVFFKSDYVRNTWLECKVKATETKFRSPFGGVIILRPGANRMEFDLALKGTVEYTAVFGSVANANNNSTTIMNRVTGVYERDIAIRMIITNLVNYAVEPDPYTNNNGVTMLSQNQATCDASPGNALYDIGHVFSTGGGGVATLACVGVTGSKARGVTGLPSPIGDPFAIDYVAHEMGHQYGANHTFNSVSGACGGGNRSASHAFEVGSGTTIMAYAGICSPENVQNASNDYFHYDSLNAIEPIRNQPARGGTAVATGNISPVVNAGADFTIPMGTPFRLTAVASDGNGDALTYCWEEFDLGAATPPITEATSPLFRSLNPSTSATRWFPKQATVLANINDPWEHLPLAARIMNFMCTVRDNRAGGGNFINDNALITISGAAFAVTAPNTAVVWTGGTNQTVTWNVGGSGGTANVRILLSTDGGNSYYNGTATVVLASTPNDGSQSITVPNVGSTTCRLFVEGVSNIFYDVSNVNFTINLGSVSANVAPSSLTVLAGIQFGGNLASLASADNNKLILFCDEFDSTGTFEITGTSPYTTNTRVEQLVTASATRNDLTQLTRMWNYNTNAYEQMDARNSTLGSTSFIINVTTSASRFVQSGTRQMKTLMTWIPQADIDAGDGWTMSTDQCSWRVWN